MKPNRPADRLTPMTRRLLALLVITTLSLSACGDDTTATTDGPISGSLHMSGGLEGLDETWSLATDGTITGPAGETGQISESDLAMVRAAIAAADFFDLDPEYMPEDICCDRFIYVLTLSGGDQTNTVTTIDAAQAPESLFRLIGAFRTAAMNALGS